MLRLGVDLGGTKIEIVALDSNGDERFRKRIATPRDDYAAIVESIGGLVDEAEKTLGVKGTVGIGAPGAVSRISGRIKNSNTVCLNDKPLKEDFEARLGREVRIANDANCFVLSEAVDGAGKGAGVVFGVILGTGVGGAHQRRTDEDRGRTRQFGGSALRARLGLSDDTPLSQDLTRTGSIMGTPIIPVGTTAILGLGTIEKRPKVVTGSEGEDVIAVRTCAYFSLSFDHRLVDGADADRFMADLKRTLEAVPDRGF